MPNLKCKMCGAELDISLFDKDTLLATCEYCGAKQTIPSVDSEKKLALFNRAIRLLHNCEFDKASGVYESIVADFPEEAEAYWGLVLCRYGIEYVDDPATGRKIPTCHRSSFENVLEDRDFEQACEYADYPRRAQYREEAKQIEELRRRIIEVSSKEEPYDIFICYKETDEKKNRTVDSLIAEDIYNALTEKGYRVFFSRITLEDKLGVEYEPYIFAALHSAKIMLAVGTDYEYYNAVWVKNEWSRFLQLIAGGEKKTLIPCYKDLDAYDMPKEFARLQAQDMGKVGAMQDLLRGVGKILPKQSAQTAVPTAGASAAKAEVTIDTLTERAYLFLREGNYIQASQYFEKVLDRAPRTSSAYWGKLLCEQKCIDNKDLASPRKCTEYFGKINFGKKTVLGYNDSVLPGTLEKGWGNSYANAWNFGTEQERAVYQSVLDAAVNNMLPLFHDAQEKLRKKHQMEERERKKENGKKIAVTVVWAVLFAIECLLTYLTVKFFFSAFQYYNDHRIIRFFLIMGFMLVQGVVTALLTWLCTKTKLPFFEIVFSYIKNIGLCVLALVLYFIHSGAVTLCYMFVPLVICAVIQIVSTAIFVNTRE